MKTMKFREDGSFSIMQLTDIHFEERGKEENYRNLTQMIAARRPDLIILTGDTVKGIEKEPIPLFCEAVRPLAEGGIPWTFIFGNHETENDLVTKEAYLRAAEKIPNYYRGESFFHAPDRYDWLIPLAARDGSIPWELFLFDSGHKNKTLPAAGDTSFVEPEQISWYRRTAAAPNGLAFLHIPLPEYFDMWDRCVCTGWRNEEVGCPRINSGLFYAMVEKGTMRGVFAGHEHINDFEGDYCGVKLCYGRVSGAVQYCTDFMREHQYSVGARMIQLFDDGRPWRTFIVDAEGKELADRPVHQPARHIFYPD